MSHDRTNVASDLKIQKDDQSIYQSTDDSSEILHSGLIKAKSFYGASSIASGDAGYKKIRHEILSKRINISGLKEKRNDGGGKSKKKLQIERRNRKSQRNPYLRNKRKSSKGPLCLNIKNSSSTKDVDKFPSPVVANQASLKVHETISPMFSSDTESQDTEKAKFSQLVNGVLKSYESNSDDINSLEEGECGTSSEPLENCGFDHNSANSETNCNGNFGLSYSSDQDSCDSNDNRVSCKDRNEIALDHESDIESEEEGESLCSFIDRSKSLMEEGTVRKRPASNFDTSNRLDHSLINEKKSHQEQRKFSNCTELGRQSDELARSTKNNSSACLGKGTGLFKYFKRTSPKREDSRQSPDNCEAKVSIFQKDKEKQQVLSGKHSPNNNKIFNQKLLFNVGKSSQESNDECMQRQRKTQKKGKLEAISPKNGPKKMEQLYIDVGQRNFGHTTCETCGMVYTKTLPEDTLEHAKYHQKLMQKLKFKGWKTERILQEFHDGRIIQVNAEDNSLHLKKISDIRDVVDCELGFTCNRTELSSLEKVFIFVSKQKVVGCAIAVPVVKAYPVIANQDVASPKTHSGVLELSWCCSSKAVPALCGISRIWVLKQARRKKVAERLVDAIRNNFIFGVAVSKEKLAFSDPTPDGRVFAEQYTGTPNFLVFR